MAFFQAEIWGLEGIMLMPPGEGGVEGGLKSKRIRVQRFHTVLVMCKFQLTAWRKAVSFWLISCVCKPEILLQARAE